MAIANSTSVQTEIAAPIAKTKKAKPAPRPPKYSITTFPDCKTIHCRNCVTAVLCIIRSLLRGQLPDVSSWR